MAIGTPRATSSGNIFRRLVGIAPIKVLAINPTKQELEKIYGTTLNKDVEYLSQVDIDDKKYEQVKINFIAQLQPFKNTNGAEVEFNDIITLTFNIRKRMKTSEAGNVQVCNAYGQTSYVSDQNLKDKTSPYDWFEAMGMRPCYDGEEDLINFIRALLNIPVVRYKDKNTGSSVKIEQPETAYMQFDNIADWFKGNFKELKDIVTLGVENSMKVLLGVQTGNEGKLYQTFFKGAYVRSNSNDYSYVEKALASDKSYGKYKDVAFMVGNVVEHQVTATEFTQTPQTTPVSQAPDPDLPF